MEFDSFSLLTGLIGGLALFLYGMNVMSSSLTKAAGGSLEKALVRLTANRWVAYLFGILITAVIQSSSATTVMVVGLVNAGLTTLAESVNLILGANLGTTFTAWLLSLNAISSDNFFIRLLKPASFTPFLAIIGVVLYMFTKTEKKKNIGAVMLGFSVLMFGMNMMSGAVAPLKSVPEFTNLLTSFSNPIFGFLVGMLFTMVVQSSSAAIGVLQALAVSVAVTYGTAIPVVMGAEVGTCITAVLSSIGAARNGKRTAAMHLSFNVIKTFTFMIGFYAINAIRPFAFLQEQAGMVGIASIHTLVNLAATVLMVPVSGILVTLAYRFIPVTDAEKEDEAPARVIRSLDDRFLSNPSFAVEQARLAAIDMAGMTKDCLYGAMSLLDKYDDEAAAGILKLEERIDNYEDQIGTYLVKLNAHHLEPQDSHEVSILQHCVNDFERMSDHARNITETFEGMRKKKKSFSDKAVAEMKVMTDAIREIMDMTVQVFVNHDRYLARRVEPLEERIDELNAEIKSRHITRLRKGKCTIDIGFDLSDLEMDLERIADHCSNVAVCVLQVDQNVFDTHEYIENMKASEAEDFRELLSFYQNKYKLPAKKNEGIDEEKNAEKAAEKTAKKEAKKEKKAANAKKAAGKKEEKKSKKKDKKGKKEVDQIEGVTHTDNRSVHETVELEHINEEYVDDTEE